MKLLISLFFSILAQSTFADSKLTPPETIDWTEAYQESVIINKPISEVWNYVSDSRNAIHWSVYFHHISPIPGKVNDGQIGSVRRCFRNEHEKGAFWDEEVLAVDNEKSRVILSFNFSGYYWTNSSFKTLVQQKYESLPENKTKLTFMTRPNFDMNFIDKFVFFFSKAHVTEIFKLNLENIKSQIEEQKRIHLYTRDSYTFFEKPIK